jgi:hypothetical protein
VPVRDASVRRIGTRSSVGSTITCFMASPQFGG